MNSTDDQPDLAEAFHPTFTGGRQEKAWIFDSLRSFYFDEVFTDVVYRVKGGKEATVYCLRAHPSTGLDRIAAKVFRPRMFRAMKNDSLYKTGRLIVSREGNYPDTRTARALKKRSRYGRALDASSWCAHEVHVLDTLWAAGADVPRVLTHSDNAILMEFVGDELQAAPILHGIALDEDEATRVLRRLLRNVQTMLSCFVVHADLSAYNVLYAGDELRLIDFPQAVDALRHPQAYELFVRDVDRLASFFARQGLVLDGAALAHDLWTEAYGA